MLAVQQTGSIHSRKKIVRFSFLAIIILVVCFAYNRYISGTIRLNPALYSKENMDLIALKWSDLISLDEAELVYNEDTETLWYKTTTGNHQTKDLVMVRLVESDNGSETDAQVHAQGSYNRVNLSQAFRTPASFGNCTSKFSVCSDSLEIWAILYDTDGSSRPFDTIFQYLLDKAKNL